MKLGAFSMSLTVADLDASRRFYELLGFEVTGALHAAGVELLEETDPDGTGPAHIVLTDPDGNRIMVDQFFDRPRD